MTPPDCDCLRVMPSARTDTGNEYSAVTIICGICDRAWSVPDISEPPGSVAHVE